MALPVDMKSSAGETSPVPTEMVEDDVEFWPVVDDDATPASTTVDVLADFESTTPDTERLALDVMDGWRCAVDEMILPTFALPVADDDGDDEKVAVLTSPVSGITDNDEDPPSFSVVTDRPDVGAVVFPFPDSCELGFARPMFLFLCRG